MVSNFFTKGWAKLPYDAAVADWAKTAWAAGQEAMDDPEHAPWWDCDGTWFIGVDALPNDAAGAIGDNPPLSGAPLEAIRRLYGAVLPLHAGQLSVTFPGYPKPRRGETEAGFRYRANRDAAHLDGLQKGEDGGRYLAEPHAWILGLPLTQNTLTQAPLVIWEGSHEVLRAALNERFSGISEADWPEVDLRSAYQEARKHVFETCRRVPVLAQPGEAILMHRLCLHGVAGWAQDTEDGGADQMRAIAYFRPLINGPMSKWLSAP